MTINKTNTLGFAFSDKETALYSAKPITHLCLICFCIGLVWLFFDDSLNGLLIGSSFLLIATIAVVIVTIYRQNWRQYLLYISFSAFFVLVYPLSGILICLFPAENLEFMISSTPSTLNLSLLVGSVGWLFLSIGFFTYHSMLQGQRYNNLKENNIVWKYRWQYLVYFGIIGLMARLFVNITFFADAFLNAYKVLGIIPAILADIGLMCSFVLILSTSKKLRYCGIAQLILQCLMGILTGQRADAFIPIVMFATFMLFLRWKISKLFLVNATLALFLIIVIIPIVGVYKEKMNELRIEKAGYERILATREVMQSIASGESGLENEGFLNNIFTITRRYSHVQYGCQLVSTFLNNYGFLHGKSLLLGIIAVIPRIIWPNKPTIGLGEIQYMLMGYEEGGSATVPVAADCYVNFEWPGVILGMFGLGFLYAFLNTYLLKKDPLLVAFLAYLNYHFMQAGMGLSNIVAILLIYGIVLFFFRKVALKGGKPSPIKINLNRPLLAKNRLIG